MTPDWIVQLKVGDVVRTRSGRLRIVRHVSHHKNMYGTRVCLSFTIQRRSWTNRAYTTVTGNDLVQAGWQPTRAKAKLNTAFDWAMEQEIHRHGGIEQCVLRARDVIGIP